MPSTDPELAKTLPIQPGMVISGKYRVMRLIAAGGMGAVLEAHHEVLDQRVAIKLMRPEISGNMESAQRFLREARAAARIESDFVARVTDVDMWEGTPFMVMQYLEGRDLDDVIEEDVTVTVSDAVDYVMQGLAGLHAAHAIGVIHRDLKPSNLYLVRRADGRDRVKILDFGISKIVGDESDGLKAGATTSTQAMLGTPRYMSPEQVSSSKDVDVRTDLWAMGLILYELLTKTYPFEGDSAGAILAAILTGDVPPARNLRREIPKELDAIVHRMLSKKREDRHPSAKSAMKALAPFASRRIQALLLSQEELQGALADTETRGTPSEVLSSARTSALHAEMAMAATAMSVSGDDLELPVASVSAEDSPATTRSKGVVGANTSAGSESRPGSATSTAMSVAGVPKKSGGAAKFLIAAVLLLGVGGVVYATTSGGNSESVAPAGTSNAEPAENPTGTRPAGSEAPQSSGAPQSSEQPQASSGEPQSSAEPASTVAPSVSSSSDVAASPPPRVRPSPRRAPPPPPPPPPAEPKKPKDLLGDWD